MKDSDKALDEDGKQPTGPSEPTGASASVDQAPATTVDVESNAEDVVELGAEDQDVPEPTNQYHVLLWEGIVDPGEGAFEYGTCFGIEQQLEQAITTPSETNVIDVWLQSGGGSADEAYRYMLLFREYASTVRVIVGRHAKSAATLMLIGADQIYMGPGSELGPLDAQVYSDELDKRISALDIARSVEQLARDAVGIALSGGGVIVGVTGIPRREVLPAVLSFTSDFFEPMVAKMEPAAIYRASSQLRIASDYAQRLLGMRKEKMSEVDGANLVYHLVNDYPDHGFIISRDEASALGLPVSAWSEYEDIGFFRSFTVTLEDQGTTAVVLMVPDSDDENAEDANGDGDGDGDGDRTNTGPDDDFAGDEPGHEESGRETGTEGGDDEGSKDQTTDQA